MTRLDLIIFGATGFTGSRAVLEMIRLSKKYPALTWGIAGRSEKKLEELKQEATQKSGEDQTNLKTFIADVSDEKSLRSMCEQARVVVNCCGPYRLYGEPVVKAAIESKTHYVDVSGEPEFMELMQLNYNEQAEDAGVYVISACGFDSIPCDLGVIHLMKNFEGVLNSVESYITMRVAPEHAAEAARGGVLHYGTWESLVHSLANSHKLKPLRKQLYPSQLPSYKPKLCRRWYHRRDGAWCLPFLGADESVVHRTQRHLHAAGARPAQLRAYLALPSALQAALLALGALLLYVLAQWSVTRRLLLDHPRLFSGGMATRRGPAEDVMLNTKFEVELVGSGWAAAADADVTEPDKKLVVKVSGSNPGYGATVTALLISALTILNEQHKMPKSGGVLTTGAAFKDTSIIDVLHENGLKFDIVSDKKD
ncbi:saccharopine dehydrogenase-like oxidoreductase isoform X1 [Bombyx mandarina]|uniref:Saccharopine dehydrogenase-like oxidoreductase isoform X1 n=1 Tax=Bombyx mandarina TaxID=7092 RepID=A0A6J2KPC6_BOMMA|nr:saccharopine dehydrogenase-like oxidoreductase isoform X1 [Bombyx mandarina]XP_028044177.1 saccharopine dehydrogenase-like oxidoreductase isoform X1 [Bombyx mandarina]XP_028044179.1 saccharopine dehydrogenase-like oxidoreductase isoform X1 [Bombyx mandarina]